MKAKFAGICKRCEKPIRVGEDIEWTRDAGASHLSCQFSEQTERAWRTHEINAKHRIITACKTPCDVDFLLRSGGHGLIRLVIPERKGQTGSAEIQMNSECIVWILRRDGETRAWKADRTEALASEFRILQNAEARRS